MRSSAVLEIRRNGFGLGDVKIFFGRQCLWAFARSLGEYTGALVVESNRLTNEQGAVRVFVRLKPEMAVDDYEDVMTIATSYMEERKVNLKGSVTPANYATY